MSLSLAMPAAQVCAFALGCALIHAARAHAAAVTRVLMTVTIIVGVLVLFGASLACAPDEDFASDDITLFNAG